MSRLLRCAGCGALNNWLGSQPGKVAKCGSCRRALDPRGRPQGVGEDGFRSMVEGAPLPVLVEFRDPADAGCRTVSSTLAAYAARRVGEIVFLSVDVEVHPQLARAHAVDGLPTFVLYANGREISRERGPLTGDDFDRWLAGARAEGLRH